MHQSIIFNILSVSLLLIAPLINSLPPSLPEGHFSAHYEHFPAVHHQEYESSFKGAQHPMEMSHHDIEAVDRYESSRPLASFDPLLYKELHKIDQLEKDGFITADERDQIRRKYLISSSHPLSEKGKRESATGSLADDTASVSSGSTLMEGGDNGDSMSDFLYPSHIPMAWGRKGENSQGIANSQGHSVTADFSNPAVFSF